MWSGALKIKQGKKIILSHQTRYALGVPLYLLEDKGKGKVK